MYRFLFLPAIFFVLFSVSYGQSDKFEFSVSDDTPASFFSSGIPTYFFSDNKVGIFSYSGNRLVFGMEEKGQVVSVAQVGTKVKKRRENAEELFLMPDGSAVFAVNDVDYSCPWDKRQNCIYSDVLIKAIDVKNLIGKTSLSKVDKSLHLSKSILKFPVGSKLYRFKTITPIYDFSEFEDFDELICSKNEDEACRGVFINGKLDKAALFELYQSKGELSSIMFAETGKDDLAYVYDIDNMTVKPYSGSCLEKIDNITTLNSCSLEGQLSSGIISEYKHKKGFKYWVVEYNNPDIDNLIFWINSAGEPFKAYTNSYKIKTINMYNETAAETISKVF